MDKISNPIYVTKSFLPPMEEYVEEIKYIWESSWLTNNGLLHNSLEQKLTNYLKVISSTLFVNGTLALETALEALNLEGEVITTPFTFAATTHAISRKNLTPVFGDIEPNTFNLDPTKIEELITDKTSAIVPVHVFGNPCDVKAINKIANKYNLKVIYDAAHAFGVTVEGKGIGTFGDVSMFSLHATKVYNSIEGGLLTCPDQSLQRKLNLLKNFGISGPENIDTVGTNAKMNEFQAAMGLVNLRYIESEIEKRKKIAYLYRELLTGIDGITSLEDIQGVKHNYSYFPIIVNEDFGVTRDVLHRELENYNIFTRKYFYPLCVDFACYKEEFIDTKSRLPIANKVSEEILTLPIYGSLSEGEIEYICESIKKIQQKNKVSVF